MFYCCWCSPAAIKLPLCGIIKISWLDFPNGHCVICISGFLHGLTPFGNWIVANKRLWSSHPAESDNRSGVWQCTLGDSHNNKTTCLDFISSFQDNKISLLSGHGHWFSEAVLWDLAPGHGGFMSWGVMPLQSKHWALICKGCRVLWPSHDSNTDPHWMGGGGVDSWFVAVYLEEAVGRNATDWMKCV